MAPQALWLPESCQFIAVPASKPVYKGFYERFHVVRDAIGGSAMLTGHFTKAESQYIAARIFKGIGMQ